jgi:plastocyanin
MALRRRVFEEYGIAAIGGRTTFATLGRHSHSATIWNAEVKDALENRLREMVRDGSLDLTEARKEIAANRNTSAASSGDDIAGTPHMKRIHCLALLAGSLAGCSGTSTKEPRAEVKKEPVPAYFKVDPGTAGRLKGTIQFTGRKPARKTIDMSGDPACVAEHHGQAVDESVVVDAKGGLANAFIYIKSGLEGKVFEVPAVPVTLDQRGCWFVPRVIGIQTGQELEITNSDPVTHNVHPLAQVNREWNHSQGPGEPALARKFIKPEVMIRVKCNIHSWMRAFIGVVDHPYFAVSGTNGTFEIRNVPPGDYVVAAWQESLGTQEQKITITPSGEIDVNFTFKGE